MNSTTRSIPPRQPSWLPNPTTSQQAHEAPRLSREEERQLILQWQEHRDRRAADRLCRCSMRFVVAVAQKYRRYNVPVDVLISEGSLGLVRAMEKFDVGKETRFSTYATYWIRFYVIDHIMRSWSIVGGGSGALRTRLFFRLRRERARAWSLYGDSEKADKVVAERLDLTRSELKRFSRQLDQRDLSLNSPTRDDSSTTLLDTLASDPNQVEGIEREQTIEQLRPVLSAALETLNSRELAIVERRLMASEDEQQSLSKLGETFGVSRERMRQIEDVLKAKLRTYISQRCSLDDLVAA